ncbi:putative epidermal cell surface receptor isoform X2 [Drosophila montana]|uniref:putative epidermal cell surface receptor isoform X2 n=1 Tax=Drosophila montana TaxID=40370 RepID=UPI00313C1B07
MILRTSSLCLLGLLLLMLLQAQVEGKDEDYGGDGGDSASGGGSDDIYEPAQQDSEVEAEMQQHRNSIEADESSLSAQSVNAMLSLGQQSTTDKVPVAGTETPVPTAAAAASTEYDENTAAEVIEDAPTQKQETKVEKPAKHSQEYYYDEMQDEEQRHDELPEQEEKSTATTTTVPDYVRKAKAERYPQPESDYAEEDMMVEQQTQPVSAPKEQEEQETNYHDEPAQPQAHIQQLPMRHKAKPFKPSSDEYYYDEQSDSVEHRITTIIPSTTTTTATDAPLPVLQARFGGFAGFGGWPAPTPSAVPSASTPPVVTTSSTSTTTSTTTTTTTTTPAPRKQSKHIHLAKPELLPADQLRNYIKDVYIRMPLAVIVDPSAASLDQAKRLYIDALQDKNINIKIVLVTLNASGVPSAFSFNNTREFIAGLNSTKEHEGGNAFVGVLHAAELVPYDSAIFISTAAIPPHTEMVQDAAITLLKKRIRLFMLWYGERSATENETEEAVGGILGEVAIRSGGEIIHIVSTEHGQHIAGNTLTLVSDAYRGSQEMELPVDTTLSSLHVRIDANMRRATLATPNGVLTN